jgi:hypothetical protein
MGVRLTVLKTGAGSERASGMRQMIRSEFRYRALAAAGVLAALGAMAPTVLAQGEAGLDDAPFIRVVDGDDEIRLETAVREFSPPDVSMPTVYLAGAVHIGRPEFYKELQAILDDKDVVLFEGVKPPGAGDVLAGEDDADRVRLTTRRVTFVGAAVEQHKAVDGLYPERLSDLSNTIEAHVLRAIGDAPVDAWGNPLVYTTGRDGWRTTMDVVSYGADGEPGGDGFDADIAFSDQEAFDAEAMFEKGEGIQSQLAASLGLVFQLDEMDHNGENWRNSDMSMDEIMDLLDASGVSGDELFSTLSGDSWQAKILGFFLKFLGSSKSSQAMMKIVLLDMLSMADEILENAPGGMGELMAVLINDRNAVVMEDLRGVIEEEPQVRTVAIIYGAGHLADLQEQIVEMGYEPADERWLTSISVKPSETGMTPGFISYYRSQLKRMMKQSIEAQSR